MDQTHRRVLVVEDDVDLRRLLEMHLRSMDFEVQVAADGQSAMARLRANPPDWVILDLMLPEVSGFELCELIRSTPSISRLPIMVVSARSSPEDRANAEDLGATTFLVKPFNKATFVKTVMNLLKKMPAAQGEGTNR